jgi:EKC/KEOPS complex subunit CGI121/TPRKB
METYTFPTFPSYATPVHIALFDNVTNASSIRKKLIEASTMEGQEGDEARAAVDFGFIDASLVSWLHHDFAKWLS